MKIHGGLFLLMIMSCAWLSPMAHDSDSDEDIFYDAEDVWQDKMLREGFSEADFACLSSEELERFTRIKNPKLFSQKIDELKSFFVALSTRTFTDECMVKLDILMRERIYQYIQSPNRKISGDERSFLMRRCKALMSERNALLVGAVSNGYYGFFNFLLRFFDEYFPCVIIHASIPSLLNALWDVREGLHDFRRTLLHVAVKEGQKAMVQLLLDRHVDVNIRDDEGNTPLHFAALYDRVDLVDMLIKARASLRTLNKEQDTPLMVAIKKRSYATAQRLIDWGSPVDQLNTEIQKLFTIPGRERNIIAFLIHILGSRNGDFDRSQGNQTIVDDV